MNNRREGVAGEQAACEYLQKQGLKILERNYSCHSGEIDVIALSGNTLVFVEVKARRNAEMGYALEAVTPQKIDRIVRTAQFYTLCKRCYERMDVRFDVVCVDTTSGKIEHIPSAFTAADGGRRRHW